MPSTDLRARLVTIARRLGPEGLATGTAGNVSARDGGAILVTPSAVPYEALTPEAIARAPLEGEAAWQGHPSSEWRFHRDILRARPEVGGIVHTHSPHATALSMRRQGIGAAHYTVAHFGGADVRCAPYAPFGTQALSDAALAALEGRSACLLANHGAIALGATPEAALDAAIELEALARVTLLAGEGAVPLSDAEIAETLAAFEGYGKP